MNLINNSSTIYDFVIPRKITDEEILVKTRGVVYCIYNKINNMRYVGETIKNFCSRYYSNKWWKYTSNIPLKDDYVKYGHDAFETHILYSSSDEMDLLQMESFYIYYYKSLYPNGYNLFYDNDPLNITEHGKIYIIKYKIGKTFIFEKDQSSKKINFYMNHHHGPCSDETKKKVSLANKGSKRTDEQKKRMSIAATGRKATKETIEKMKLSLIGKHCKRVIQIDPINNKIIKEFPSCRNASIFLGLKSSSNISSVCRGRQKTIGGFIFKYKE